MGQCSLSSTPEKCLSSTTGRARALSKEDVAEREECDDHPGLPRKCWHEPVLVGDNVTAMRIPEACHGSFDHFLILDCYE
jgi:hypothetical protein